MVDEVINEYKASKARQCDHVDTVCTLPLMNMESSNFQLVRGPQNWVWRHFQAEAVWSKLLL